MRESEARYQDLVEHSHDMIYTHDLSGVVLFANQTSSQLLGLAPSEVVGKRLTEFLVPEVRDQFDSYLAEVSKNGVASGLMLVQTNTGEKRVCEYSNALADDADGVVRCIARDVTERKRAEEALRQSEQRFAAFMNNTSVLTWIKDNDFRYAYANEPFARRLGRSVSDIVGKTDFELLPTETAQQFRANDETVLASDKLLETHETIHARDGSLRSSEICKFPLHDAEGRLYVGGMAIDITDRKRAEDTLRESEERFRALIEHSQDAIALFGADGSIVYCSPSTTNVMGYLPEDLYHHNALEFVRPDYHDAIRALLAESLSHPGVGIPAGAYLRHKNGQWRFLEGTFTNLLHEPSVGAIVNNYRDITERKLAEARSAAFATLARRLSGARVPLDATRIIVDAADELFGWDSCTFDLYDPREDLIHAILRIDTIEGLRSDSPPDLETRPPTQKGRDVIERGARLTLREAPYKFDDDTLSFGDKDRPSASIMSVPIRHAAEVVGILSIQSYEPQFYDHDALRDLQALADHCGQALNRIWAEEELRKSEERYRDLVENGREMICTHDLDGLVLSANPAAAAAIGYDLDEYVGKKTIRDLLAPEVKHQFDEYMARLCKDGATTGIMLVQTKSGDRRVWEYYNSLRTEGVAAPIVRGMARDITERKRAEALLAGEKQVLEMIAGGMHLPDILDALTRTVEQQSKGLSCSILLLDADGVHLRHGAAPSLPDAYCRAIDGVAIGPSAGSCGTAAFRKELVLVEDVATDPLWEDYRELALEHGLRACWSTPILTADRRVLGTFAMYYGEPRSPNPADLELIGRATHLAAIAIERRHAEHALRESERRYRDIFTFAPVGIYQSLRNGTLLTVNKTLAEMLAYDSADEFLKVNLADVYFTPDERQNLIREYEDLGYASDIELRWKRKDGFPVWIQLTTHAIKGADGLTKYFEGFVRDITERKRTEMEREVISEVIQSVNLTANLDELLKQVHQSLKRVLYAENCCVALFDKQTGLFEASLFVDQVEANPFPMALHSKTCTAKVFSSGQPLLMNEAMFAELRDRGEVELIGRPSQSFLAVPLMTPAETIGVIVVQHYEKDDVYSQRDVESLSAVAAQLALAIERKRAEEALKKSESDYRHLFNNANDAILIFEPEGENILEANAAACDIYGYSRDELIGMSLKRLTKSVLGGESQIKELLDAGTLSNYESIHFNNKGEEIHFLINSSVIDYQDRQAILSINRDITERKLQEAALHESETMLKQSQRVAVLGHYVFDVANGSWTSSEVLDEIFGIDAAYTRNVEGWLGIVHPEQRDEMDAYLRDHVLKERNSFDREYRIVRISGGAVRWVHGLGNLEFDTEGEPARMFGVIQDITERKLIEEALRESESFRRTIFDSEPECVKVVGRDFTLLDMNPAGLRMIGASSREQVIGQSVLALVAPEWRSAFTEMHQEVLRGESVVAEFETCGLDGVRRWMETHAVPLRDKEQMVTGHLAITRDITERRHAERAVRESEERYRDLVENIQDLVCTHDLDGRVLSANPALEKLLGYNLKEFGEKSFREILAPEARDQFDDYLMRIRRDGVASGLMLVQTSAGERRVWEYHNTLRTEGVAAPIVRSLARDITERRRAEKAMSVLRRELELTMNAMEEGVHRVDLHGKIVFENPAAARMLGWEVSELLGKSGHLTMHHTRPDGTSYPVEECPIYASFRDGVSRQVTDEVFWRQDGTSFPVEYTTAPVRDDRNELVATVVTFRDITERKLAEAALSQSEREYRGLFENAHDAILLFDPEGEIVLEVNQRACEMYGIERSEFVGMSLEAISGDVVGGRSRIKETLDRGSFFNFETTQRRGDGTEMVLDINASVVPYKGQTVIQSINRDITDRKRAEQALRESEERYRTLFENSRDAIYIHDLNGNYTSVNPAAEKLSGYGRDEIIGRNFAEFLAQENVDQVRARLWQKVREKGGTTYEAEVITKDGKHVPIEVSSRLVYANGVAIGVQGSARDITEPKRARQALQDYSRRLIAAQEVERRRIARELHDQIGQMLTALKLNTHAIQVARDAHEAWRLSADNLNMLDEALEQVRDLSIDLRPALLDDLGLATALRWYVERQAQRTGVRAEFTIDLPDPDLRFSTELETACFRIAQEALTNVARHAQAKLVTVRLSRDEQHLHLAIADDGVGFDIESLRGQAVAATLGLHGMEERAQALGGRIKIESSRDKGTQVSVQLPITMSNAAKAGTQETRRAGI